MKEFAILKNGNNNVDDAIGVVRFNSNATEEDLEKIAWGILKLVPRVLETKGDERVLYGYDLLVVEITKETIAYYGE